MKKVFIVLLILLTVPVLSQDKTDSLLNQLSLAGEEDRIGILKELSWEFRYSRPEEALKYGLEALTLVKEYERFEFEASINNYLGIIQRNVGNHAMALEYFIHARRSAQIHNNREDLAYAYNNIGDIHNLEGNYGQALQYEFQALQIFEEIGDSLGISYACHQIALAHTNLFQYHNALDYHKRAMNVRIATGNRIGVAYSLISIGETHLNLGNLAESLTSLKESQEIFMEHKDDFGLSLSMHHLGLYYKSTGQTEEAISYFTEALNLGREKGIQIRVRNAARELSEIYADQFRYQEAYQMHILFKDTYDSLYLEENLVKITQLILQNKFEQKEILQQAEINKQKQVRNYLILSIALVVILVIVLQNRYSIKRRANIVLEKQKAELNETLSHLTQAQSQLVQSEKMASLGQVTAGVAHELNNPLNFVSTSVKPLRRNMEDLMAVLDKYDAVIQENKLDDSFIKVEKYKQALDFNLLIKETKDLLEGVNEGASRSETIVKGLRTFSKMDENEFKGVNIHEGIDSTLLLLSNKLKDRITVHKNYGSIPEIDGLPGKLNQVFMNILSNSIMAIEGKGDIFITTERVGDQARISIKDNGEGMSEETRQHIFEPFFTTRAVGQGTGLGLSITYSIIEEHRGSIEVKSAIGKGAEFIIKLPLIGDEDGSK